VVIAALWDEFLDEDPYGDPIGSTQPRGASSPPGGIPFLQDVLTNAFIIVEVAFGANINSSEPQFWNWYEITTDVRQADGGGIGITVGSSDESSQASPASCNFSLDNTSGNYSPYNPASKWWPNVVRNTPVRVRLYINGTYYTRFQGQINGWIPSWDTSCNLAVITMSASGKLRQLQQGKTPLRSPLYRAITQSSPAAYWSLEDGSSATQAASGLPGGTPLVVGSSAPKFGSKAMTGSAPVVDFSGGGQIAASIATTSSTSWRLEFEAIFPTGQTGSPSLKVVTWYTQGSANEWWIGVTSFSGSPVLELGFTTNAGLFEDIFTALTSIFDGNTHQIRVDASQSGSNIKTVTTVDGIIADTYSAAVGTLGPITGVALNSEGSTSTLLPAIGHLSIWAPYSSSVNTTTAATGWLGETASARLVRLCNEEGVTIAISGVSDTAMGSQTVDTFENLLRECETTDDGLLYDGFGPGLSFATRQFRYNAVAMLNPDVSLGQVDDPFEPVDDDQRNRNLVTVNRKNGSSAIVEQTTGSLGTDAIGIYDTSVTVNTKDDSNLSFRAGWEVRKGIAEGFRYPTLNLNLAATPIIIPAWLATPLSGRIDVMNVSSKAIQHPPGTVSLLAEGYTETLTPFDWDVTINCSPYDPWRVALIEGSGDNAWRVDAGSSTLVNPALVGDTSITVQTTDGLFWSTSAGDYPRTISVGGVQVTVTAVGAASGSNQTFTVDALQYALPAGSTVALWHPPAIAL
jgi:hypothetical protein